jgi:uncharacterized protein YndB with AHSA1/START domain
MSESIVSHNPIPPVVKRLWMPLPVDAAFRLFAEEIGGWWPLLTHSVFGEEAETCTMDPYESGRFYEVHADGRESEWGRVLAWEPPHRLVLSFYAGHTADEGTDLEVVFEPEAGGCRLVLTQGGWERRGVHAQAEREDYDSGWDEVLQRYAECASSPR